jgi:hypothetical protein
MLSSLWVGRLPLAPVSGLAWIVSLNAGNSFQILVDGANFMVGQVFRAFWSSTRALCTGRTVRTKVFCLSSIRPSKPAFSAKARWKWRYTKNLVVDNGRLQAVPKINEEFMKVPSANSGLV